MSENRSTGDMRVLTTAEREAVGGGVWGVVAGVAVGALIFLTKAAEEAYLAKETAWYAAR